MNKDIRTAFIVSSMNRGGAETKLVAVANRLRNQSVLATVYVLKNGPLTDQLKIPFEKNLMKNKYDLPGFFRLTGLLKKGRFDVVWVLGNGDAGFYGRLAAKAAGVHSIVQSFHATGRTGGRPTIDPGNRFLDKLRVFTSRYIAVAKQHRDYMINREGIPAGKISHIYNGVDIDHFSPGTPSGELKSELGIRDSSRVVGIVARLKPEKRHDVFLQAANLVLSRIENALFLVIGDGPLEGDLKRQARELGIEKRVVFTGGVRDSAPYYKLMDLCVLCSDTVETFSNVVLEAMASGVPLVATETGSVSEAIINRQTGILVQPNDIQGIACGVTELLTDDELHSCVRSNGLARVRNHFTLDGMVKGRVDLFRELMS